MRTFALAPLFTVALLAATAPAQNVLLVIADDLGTDKVGLYDPQSPPPPTPTLDALAAQGVQFQNAWSCPVCSPTRATLLTGRYPFRTGVGTAIPFGPPLPPDELTIASILDLAAAQGGAQVATAAIGKWHLADIAGGSVDPLRRGFDHWAGSNLGALAGPFDYEFWPQTVDTQTDLSTTYATTAAVDAAGAWIAQQTSPWFCYLAFNAPHTPFHAPPAELHGQVLPDVDPESDPVPFYDAMVEAMDTELGRLLAQMDPAALAATTIIVVGDNGTTGDVVLPPYDPERSKGSLYQNGIRVPLIVSGAQVAAPGRQVSALVDVSDLFATVLELLGADWVAALPDERLIDSVSMLPYVVQPVALPQREWVLSQSILNLPGGGGGGPLGGGLGTAGVGPATTSLASGGLIAGAALESGIAIRNTGFKLIRRDDGGEELYNLLLDPTENVDLLTLPVLPTPAAGALAELSAVLDGLASE
ncbi:sulfatase-like hydrolase/transferase [Engelhardtia mirabilis]|uniref:Arylsulfatase n=1 Tax=Engelhardtia mirabilis TaxID=2528011 RepID=A0A518BGP9_9BACT|nr:Arylsulfatase precursor [Planctomycetes bacterium Pla133]QDV00430.1 Arylsulfatase precursor [Planctomycetes bacterium Pla86]